MTLPSTYDPMLAYEVKNLYHIILSGIVHSKTPQGVHVFAFDSEARSLYC